MWDTSSDGFQAKNDVITINYVYRMHYECTWTSKTNVTWLDRSANLVARRSANLGWDFWRLCFPFWSKDQSIVYIITPQLHKSQELSYLPSLVTILWHGGNHKRMKERMGFKVGLPDSDSPVKVRKDLSSSISCLNDDSFLMSHGQESSRNGGSRPHSLHLKK